MSKYNNLHYAKKAFNKIKDIMLICYSKNKCNLCNSYIKRCEKPSQAKTSKSIYLKIFHQNIALKNHILIKDYNRTYYVDLKKKYDKYVILRKGDNWTSPIIESEYNYTLKTYDICDFVINCYYIISTKYIYYCLMKILEFKFYEIINYLRIDSCLLLKECREYLFNNIIDSLLQIKVIYNK